MFDMNRLVLLLFVATLFNGVTTMVHTLRYFHTSSSHVPNFPEFVSVGYVNDILISHYDSRTKRYVPRQEWMKKITEEDPQYWKKQTQISLMNEQTERLSIKTAKQRLNVTGDLHLWQNMYGCDWDDETNEIRGYDQYGFDGEDFISFDFDTQTFIVSKQQAYATQQYWKRIGYAGHQKNYIIKQCAEYLKKHVRNGEHVLKRKVLPVVSLLQKTSVSPVTCHATGFFPDRALLFWAKDGEELPEDPGEILPNHDGTFQSSVSLDLSSVPPEDWHRFSCVFQLSGVKDDLITKLERHKIRTNERPSVIGFVAGLFAVVLVFLTVVTTMVLYKRRKAKRPPTPCCEPEEKEELHYKQEKFCLD